MTEYETIRIFLNVIISGATLGVLVGYMVAFFGK